MKSLSDKFSPGRVRKYIALLILAGLFALMVSACSAYAGSSPSTQVSHSPSGGSFVVKVYTAPG